MVDNRNPYAPSAASVAEPAEPSPAAPLEGFIPNGRRVPGGRGAGWIGDAWRLFKARPGKWLLALVLVGIVYIAVSSVPFLGSFAASVLWPFIVAGIVMAADLQRRTGTFELDAFFAASRKATPILVLGVMSLLTTAVFFGVFAIGLGTRGAFRVAMSGKISDAGLHPEILLLVVLCYLALVIPITAALWLAPPLIMFHDVRAGAAMKMSLIASFRNFLPGIVFGLCTLAFVLVSIIPLGLGLLVSLPVMTITNYTVYRDIFIDPASE